MNLGKEWDKKYEFLLNISINKLYEKKIIIINNNNILLIYDFLIISNFIFITNKLFNKFYNGIE